ncbi:hypothetical protein [Hymenobacter glacieicola]|uniref:Uncharacterized protein n=1 Tax=Hymenobacter glacieicola TaxID=1562124 RepID=A0ABQ1WLW2_9BACT|nr:hypothetical protein [Hymenobacter glacieicola]GGG33395.1 hypothetical protein GCM10011378_07340 [Hymenobacter glacieicola]
MGTLNNSAVQGTDSTGSQYASYTDANVDANGNPTEAQIEEWRRKHGKVKCFEVDGKLVYFKQPTRQLVSAATAALTKTRDVSVYQETIMKNTQLNFVDETDQDVELYFALAGKVDEIITSKSATLKN